MLAAERATGKRPPELDVPPLPSHARQVWHTFLALHRKRRSGMSAPEGIADSEILSWQHLHGVRLSPWELQAIDELDAAFLQQAAEQAEKQSRRQHPGGPHHRV